MELIFLNEQTLEIVDYAYCTDDYEIVLDALIPQKSKFTVTKQSLNVEISDLLVVRDGGYFYVGIITSMSAEDNNTTKIESMDFLSILDVDVPLPTSFEGNVASFLVQLINQNYKTNSDSYQNISYLDPVIEVNKPVNLTFEADAKDNILDLIEDFNKTLGIRVCYELVLENGRFSKLRLKIVESNIGIRIKSDLGTITDLVVNDINENSLNKVIYVAKSDNEEHHDTVVYYLQTDGTVTTNNVLALRYPKVKFKYEFYSDKDYPNLETKASKALIDSSLKHNITFNFSFFTNKIEGLSDLKLGTFVEFLSKDKVYETLVTKMVYKKTLKTAEITLGEYRVSLTDKIKLLDRRKN